MLSLWIMVRPARRAVRWRRRRCPLALALVPALGLASGPGCGRVGYDLLPYRSSGVIGGSPAANDASGDGAAGGTPQEGAGGASASSGSSGVAGSDVGASGGARLTAACRGLPDAR